MIDVGATQIALDSLGDYPTYAVARHLMPVALNLLGEEASANSMVSWLNLGYAGQGGTIQKYQDQLAAYNADLSDTAAHPDDQVYGSWAAFKNTFMAIVEEANAIEEGTGHTFADISTTITTDIPDAVANAPGVIGDVVGEVGAAAGNAVGNTAGGLLSSLLAGAGLPLLIGAAVLVYVYVKAR